MALILPSAQLQGEGYSCGLRVCAEGLAVASDLRGSGRQELVTITCLGEKAMCQGLKPRGCWLPGSESQLLGSRHW